MKALGKIGKFLAWKRYAALGIAAAFAVSCSGCVPSGAMVQQGKQLLEEGQALNRELAESAAEVNSRILEEIAGYTDGEEAQGE